ncbi:MAG: hypothetical protein Q8K32_11025 [Archangium sp.]|nr:hypothetical protein [Archangium sp.]
MTPDEREKMKRQIAMLGSLEQSGTDISRMSLDQAPDDDMPIATPTRRVIVPRAGPPEVPVPTSAPIDPDAELTAAKGADVDAFNDRATEMALRQMVAGITRTKVPDSTVNQLGTGEKDLLGRRRQSQLDALRQLEAGNNAARTDAYVKGNEAAAKRAEAGGERADRKLSLDETEAERRDARFEAEQVLKAADLERKKAADAARVKKGSGKAPPARDASGKLIPTSYRDQLKGDALKPRSGWEPIVSTDPTFRDAGQAKMFDGAVAAMGAIRNHRDHVLHEVEALKNAKTPAEADTIAGRLNAQMGALASKLRDAEGLNNTDASNQAVENMLSLSHGSAINWKNLMNQGRLPSILNAAIDSGEANLDTMAASNNLRRSKGGAAAPGQAPGHTAGKVVVSNGKETMEIDAADEAAAAKDGFKRVK